MKSAFGDKISQFVILVNKKAIFMRSVRLEGDFFSQTRFDL
jgi:hypothetical protein